MNFRLVIKGFLIDEGIELSFPVDSLHLREDQFYRVQVISIRYVVDGLNVVLIVRFFHISSSVNC